MSPKVSVVVPIYGVEKYLNQCIDSILNQTLKEIEIILVDDGSKDKCPQIVDEYAAKDKRIIAIHQENGGYGKAVNHGLDVASGEYISIIESDDFAEPTFLEKLYLKAKKYDADISKCDFNLFFEHTKHFQKGNMSKNRALPQECFLLKECPLFLYFHPSIWSCLYKKTFLDKFDLRIIETKGASWQDNLFQVQTMVKASKIVFVDEYLINYRKFHQNESFDLKDEKIPYERSKEIHQWLNENHITDEDILACLYKREIAYMHIILHMKGGLKHIKKIAPMINEWIDKIPQQIISTNKYINHHERKFVARIRKNPDFWLFIYRLPTLKQIRKFFISLKIKKQYQLFQIFGIQLTNGMPDKEYPALLKIKL